MILLISIKELKKSCKAIERKYVEVLYHHDTGHLQCLQLSQMGGTEWLERAVVSHEDCCIQKLYDTTWFSIG